MLAGSQTKGKRDMRFAGSSGSTFSRRPTNPHRTNSSTIALFSDGMARKAVQVLEDRETRVLDAAPPLPVQQLQLGDAQQESRVVRFRRRTASSPSRTRAGCRQTQRLQMMFKKNLRGVGCSRGIIEPGQAKPPSCGEKPRTGPPWARSYRAAFAQETEPRVTAPPALVSTTFPRAMLAIQLRGETAEAQLPTGTL